MLEHARMFLSRALPAGIGNGAHLNIHWMSRGSDGGKYWDGRATNSLEEALRTINWVSGLGGNDIYVCMSLQARYEEKTSRAGNVYKKAQRLSESAVALKSLFVDIDVKEEAYPDTASALAALEQFIAATNLPMPSVVVASGSGGFHVHWALDEALDREHWQPLANALAMATRAHGLICDSQCTVDAARILRIPGTLNLKHDVPAEVTLLSYGDEVSVERMAEVLSKYKSTAPVTRIPDNDDLGANMPFFPQELHLEKVAKNCPFVGRTVDTGGKNNNQPLWFMTATIATFLEDGRAALHKMSNGHPDYAPPDTDALYDRVVNTRARRDIGWPQCQKIAIAGAPECADCPLLANNKSPLNFATPDPAKAIDVDASLPSNFVRSGSGIIQVRTVDDEGRQLLIPICHYPILNGWLSNNPWTFHLVTKDEASRRVVVDVPAEVIGAKDGFSKYMSGRGFFLTTKQYQILKEFFVSWMQKLQQHKEKVISSAPFGWSVVDGKIEGFAYGGRVWMKDGDRPAANANPTLQQQYTPKGDIKVWREAAKIVYEQGRPSLDTILAVAFAAPLVKFTGFGGLIINAYSPESGIGKTTAMKVSQSVWANPVMAMQGLNDTTNAVLGKAGQVRCLPLYWDEIKSAQQVSRFCSIVFELTGGREKARMNVDTSLRVSGSWQTMMVSASNDSLIDGMSREAGSTTAGIYRLFEYVVEVPTQVTSDISYVQRLLGRLDDNYGHAGQIYSRFLGENHERVDQEMARLMIDLTAELKIHTDERMWLGSIATLLKGAEYANELGLTKINVPAMRRHLISILTRMRGEIDSSPADMTNDISVSAVLAELLSATRSRNTLVTDRIWVARGKPPKGSVQVRCDTNRLEDIVVQIGKDDKLIRISSTFLTRWMGERGYSRHTFVTKLEKEFGLTKVNGKLGGGTDLACAMEHLIELDANHPRLSPLVDI